MDVSAVAHAGHRSGGCGECRLTAQVGSGGRDERWIIGDSAVVYGSGEVKKEKGAGSLGRGSRMMRALGRSLSV